MRHPRLICPFELNSREKRALEQLVKAAERDGYFEEFWNGKIRVEDVTAIKVNTQRRGGPFRSSNYSTGNPPDVTINIHIDELHAIAQDLERSENSSRFSALLYPNSSASDSTLKHAILYFDDVFLIKPDIFYTKESKADLSHEPAEFLYSSDHGEGPLAIEASRLTQEIDFFEARTFDLRRLGMLHFLSPSRCLSRNFYASVERDISDPSFVRTVEANGVSPMFIGASKMLSLENWSCRDSRVVVPPDEVAQFLRRRIDWSNGLFGHYGWVRAAPTVAASVLLNHAIAACHDYNLSPVAQQPVYEQLLMDKFERVSSSLVTEAYRSQLRATSAAIAQRVMTLYMPKLELRSFDDMLELKYRLAEQLAAFRIVIAKFAADVRATPIEPTYLQEIERVVAARIAPAIEEIRSKLEGLDRRLVGTLMRNAKAGTVPIIATLFAGVPLPLLLALSAGFLTVEALWETYSERKEIVDLNGLSLVFCVD